MNVGNLGELGGLDIESIEVIKGAAGASLYGTTAANGVITIKTKRGANSDGIQFNVREEYGVSDLNSARYGQPVNVHLQLDETGKRFCISGTSTSAPCSKTVDWMTEIMRINNVNADTNRTPQSFQWNALNNTDGSLENVYQSNIWPNQYYNTLAQVGTSAPTQLSSVDATGKIGTVRFFASGQYTNNGGALKDLQGDIQSRARVNLDYDVRSNFLLSVSTVYDKETTDERALDFGLFGSLLRGAPAGTNYLATDTLGRPILQGGGSNIRGTANGANAFLYPFSASSDELIAGRYIGSITGTYFPADWVTFDGTFAYDKRSRYDAFDEAKDFRTISADATQQLRPDEHRQCQHRSHERQLRCAVPQERHERSDRPPDVARPVRPDVFAQQRRVRPAVRREGRVHAEQHEHAAERDLEQPIGQGRRIRLRRPARLQGQVHRRRNVPVRRQLALRRGQSLGAVRPRVRCVARVRRVVLEGPAHHRFPSPRVARHRGQHAVVRRAVRDVQLRHHRMLAGPGRQQPT